MASILRRCAGVIGQGVGQSRSITVVTWTDMANSQHAFVRFIKLAANSPRSPEAHELHVFLTRCFFDADDDYDGLVNFRGFDQMVSVAAQVPRRFGFAPLEWEMFSTKEELESARLALFDSLRQDQAKISLEQWLRWAKPHALNKGRDLDDHVYARWERSKEDCVEFFKGVARASGHSHNTSESAQLKEFYVLTHDLFVKADTEHTGLLGEKQFERLLAQTSEMTNRFGLDWYASTKFSDVAVDGYVRWASWFSYNAKLVSTKAQSV